MTHIRRLLIALVFLYTLALGGYLFVRWVVRDALWWASLLHGFALFWFIPLLLTLPLSLLLMYRTQKPSRFLRWTALSQLVLGFLAILWFILPILPKNVEPATGSTLKIVSINVLWLGNQQRERVNDWLVAQDADVIVMPEIPTIGFEPELARVYSAYPYEAGVAGSLKIFSKHRFITNERLWIEAHPPGRLIRRVVIEIAGQPIAIYGVHLSLPQYEPDPDKAFTFEQGFPIGFASNYDETRRNAQIVRLLELVQDDPYPVIVAGDFNMSEHSLIYDDIAEVLTDSWRIAGTGFGTTWAVMEVIRLPSFIPPLLRLDYVWHTDEFRTVSATLGEAIGSDHLPLVVELEIR